MGSSTAVTSILVSRESSVLCMRSSVRRAPPTYDVLYVSTNDVRVTDGLSQCMHAVLEPFSPLTSCFTSSQSWAILSKAPNGMASLSGHGICQVHAWCPRE